MLAATVMSLLLVMQVTPPKDQSFLPTSGVIDVARMVARGLGYPLSNRSKYFFDLLPAKGGEPPIPGYITVGFYWNSDTVNAISIDAETGQVLDFGMCTVFQYPSIKRFQREIRKGGGSPPLSLEQLRARTGCDSLKVVTRVRSQP